MAYFSTEPASERRNVTGKNRVWDFFELSNETHPANRRQPAQPRRKIRPTPTKTVSGIPYWPSRDPIDEVGGVNLYGFVGNDGIDWADLWGLYYNQKVKDLFGSVGFCCKLFEAANQFGVNPIALAMAMADEYMASGPGDAAQDALALATGGDKPLGKGQGDIGPFNLHVDSVMEDLQKHGNEKGKQLTKEQVITMVQVPQIAVFFAASLMKEVQKAMAGKLDGVSDYDKIGHWVQGWRQGPENRITAMEKKKKADGAGYKPDHNMDDYDERVKEIKGILGDCSRRLKNLLDTGYESGKPPSK